jgi:hypothetical protein
MGLRKKKSVETEEMGVLDLIQQDTENSQQAIPQQAQLDKLGKAVLKAESIAANIVELEEDLKQAKKDLAYYITKIIPDIFDELGLKTIVLSDGAKVTVDSGFVASIKKENQPIAYKWLRENNHGDLIKHELTVKLTAGEDEFANDIKEDLNLLGATYSDKESVHYQTLKSFVNEQMENGTKIPEDIFGIHPIRTAKIKR